MQLNAMQSLQQKIHAWADSVFPDRTLFQQLAKLVLEEIPEMLQNHHDGRITEGEIADCFIILLDIAEQSEIDAYTAILDKMTVNENRKWRRTPDGLMKHIQDVDLAVGKDSVGVKVVCYSGHAHDTFDEAKDCNEAERLKMNPLMRP